MERLTAGAALARLEELLGDGRLSEEAEGPLREALALDSWPPPEAEALALEVVAIAADVDPVECPETLLHDIADTMLSYVAHKAFEAGRVAGRDEERRRARSRRTA